MVQVEFKIIKGCVNPKILVMTPLAPAHEISDQTKRTIVKTDVPYVWASAKSSANIPMTLQEGIRLYKGIKGVSLPEYFLQIDNDNDLGEHLIDKLYDKLKSTPDYVAYSYATHSFTGEVRARFPAIPFDAGRLISGNYINSNSLIKMRTLDAIGGFVLDEEGKYIGLGDWCNWLKFLSFGYIGIACPEACFILYASKESIAVKNRKNIRRIITNVRRDFIEPLQAKAASFNLRNRAP